MHKMPEKYGKTISQINGSKDRRNAVENRKDEDIQVEKGAAIGVEEIVRPETPIFLQSPGVSIFKCNWRGAAFRLSIAAEEIFQRGKYFVEPNPQEPDSVVQDLVRGFDEH